MKQCMKTQHRLENILEGEDICFIGEGDVVEGFLDDIKSSTFMSIPVLRHVAGTLCHQHTAPAVQFNTLINIRLVSGCSYLILELGTCESAVCVRIESRIESGVKI